MYFFQSERGLSGKVTQTGRNYVQLLGQVKIPGEYPYKDGADLYDYLIKAGGPNEKADLQKFELIRGDSKERITYTFALDDLNKIPGLQPGDTVLVHADNPSVLEKKSRVIGGLTSILTSLATVVLIFVSNN